MKLVAFEGLDGSGKTAVAPRVAARLGAQHVALPPAELALDDPGLFRRDASMARYLYYLAGVAAIGETVCRGQLIVCDRYLASAHALHVDVGAAVRRAAEALPLRPADLTIFLEVSEPERRTRLKNRARELDPFERRLLDDPQLRRAVRARLLADENLTVVSTDGRSVAEIVEASIGIIVGHGSLMNE